MCRGGAWEWACVRSMPFLYLAFLVQRMPPQIICLPFVRSPRHDIATFPRTRADAVAVAEAAAHPNTVELHLLATAEVDELCELIELARVELSRDDCGMWCLQYISHPSQSVGLTSQISPQEDDLKWRMRGVAASRLTPVVDFFSSDEMQAEGLEPCARLDLRPANAFPVVPSVEDTARLARFDLGVARTH